MSPEVLDAKAPAEGRLKLFEYTTFGADGQRSEGHLAARDEAELDRLLERKGLTLSKARRTQGGARSHRERFNHAQLVAFTTQLSTLLDAGVPMLSSLRHGAKRMQVSAGRGVVDSIVRSLEGGLSLSEALDIEAKSFPEVYRASVRAGEHSMELPAVLSRQAQQLRWVKEIRGSVSQALIYPVVLMVAVLGLVAVLLVFLLPRLTVLFPKDAVLPWQTRWVLALSDFAIEHSVLLGGGILLGVLTFVGAQFWKPTRCALSRLLLALPRLGELVRMVSTARFAATMADLHGAGCDVLMTLDVAGKTCGSAALQEGFARVAERVRTGATIAESLDQEPLMDPLLVQLIDVGEASGELEPCLRRVASCYDEEVPRKVKWALSLLEPLLIAGAAVVVGFILLAAILPILDLYDSIT